MVPDIAKNTFSVKGLDPDAVLQARKKHGDNSITSAKKSTLVMKLAENFRDPIIRILLCALILNVALTWKSGSIIENIGIVTAIIISTVVSTISEYGSERAFERLKAQAGATVCRVVRDGKVCLILSDDIVVGDMVKAQAGDFICADGVMVTGKLSCDQSSLNGESTECTKFPKKEDGKPELNSAGYVFRGSTVLSGEGSYAVCAVGSGTMYGSLARELEAAQSHSPLKQRLSHLARQISHIGYAAAALVALVYLFNEFVVAGGYSWPGIYGKITDLKYLFATLLHALTLAVTVVVVAVPEGLPMMITVVLSSNMKRMLKDNVLVKKLVGIETAGSMNILFCDKTGTITYGKMKVNSVICGDGTVLHTESEMEKNRTFMKYMTACAIYNTDCSISGGGAVGGNGTDRAILDRFLPLSVPSCRVGFHTPFDSSRRYEAVSLSGELTCSIIKGAGEVLMPKVVSFLDINGEKRTADVAAHSRFEMLYREAASKGERVLCVCLADSWSADISEMDSFTLVGFICLKDKVRQDAKTAVCELRRAGISVVMMTGDSPDTAYAISCESGICAEGKRESVMTGAELAMLSDEDVIAILPSLRVVARALPGDKSRLVRLAQRAGMVVGMTGDGVNDAPSLKAADVGFAMGNGTDVSKEAADIVLLDSKLRSVAYTVLYGRTIFKSIRKFITFQLMMNLCAVGVSLFGQYVGIESPVTIIQMLWVNLIMDTLGGLAFAGEPALECYMREPPKKREEPILCRSMIWQIAVTGSFTLALCAFFLGSVVMRGRYGFVSGGGTEYLTAFFVLFIFCGIFNCFNVRTERFNPLANLRKNKPFVIIMAAICMVQLLLVYFGGTLFRTVPLEFAVLLRVVGLAFTVVAAELLRKTVAKLKG